MAIYMKYGSIKGQTTTENWKDWITLASCQFGAGRAIGSAKGKGANREGSEPSISEISAIKDWDAVSSSKLFEESVSGELSRKVEICFTTTSGDRQETFLLVKLENAGISSYAASSNAEGKPMESLSINFAKIEVTPLIVDEKLATKAGEKVSFNLETMKANA
jgi:type VI secretion system secreted protein Hcp